MAEPLLAVSGLRAGYGDVQVLWGVDFAVHPGEIACLVGSNGAGKTTLLRALSGLLPPSEGSIRFAGGELAGASPERVLGAGIAHVPEGRRLFAAMSVRDNLLMGAYLRRDGAAALARDLERIYEVFPILAERRAQDAGTLSGGEQQMCAVARGLMSAPRLLLIDELSLGLAPAVVDQLSDALRALNREGLTLLVVEQDVATALELARDCHVMDSGRITRSAPSEALRNDPAIREAYLGVI
ncbi:MAG: ABC transporter ATP-binding protein [Betaproteobacteria bacterium]|nr:MAG: ABC transporter ATP-binding protein [Betaproteobacteria bacterium]